MAIIWCRRWWWWSRWIHWWWMMIQNEDDVKSIWARMIRMIFKTMVRIVEVFVPNVFQDATQWGVSLSPSLPLPLSHHFLGLPFCLSHPHLCGSISGLPRRSIYKIFGNCISLPFKCEQIFSTIPRFGESTLTALLTALKNIRLHHLISASVMIFNFRN